MDSRLGWRKVRETMPPRLDAVRRFAEQARADGFRRVLLLGMGGSSLFPEVLTKTLGRTPEGIDLRILDSIHPADVRAAESADKTLYLVCSKSGTTIEVSSLYRHFATKAPADHFAAITDPGTPLETLAKSFRACFLNPPDIGGRYSALSLFGLVPAALLGWDPARFLAGAWENDKALAEDLASRDTLPLSASPFSDWVEQLVAESLGKNGKGVLPMPGDGPDPLGAPATPERLGEACWRWMTATQRAGELLGVDPFDQPDVEDAKARTRRILAGEKPALPASGAPRPGRIRAVLAWLPRNPESLRKLQPFLQGPSVLNWGPRYLHSTGQLHKGGKDLCDFILVTAEGGEDLPIPGETYSFGDLVRAQSWGDLAALKARGRRVQRIVISG